MSRAFDSNYFYLASPYSHKDEEVRIQRERNVSAVGAELTQCGLNLFCPITQSHRLNTFLSDSRKLGHDECMRVDYSFLTHAKALLVLKLEGWEQSVGVAAEMRFAADNGIPVYLVPFPLWAQDREELLKQLHQKFDEEVTTGVEESLMSDGIGDTPEDSKFWAGYKFLSNAKATHLFHFDPDKDDWVLAHDVDKLWDAVYRLYYAAHWSADVFVDEERLWEDLREAAGFTKGSAPGKVVGMGLPNMISEGALIDDGIAIHSIAHPGWNNNSSIVPGVKDSSNKSALRFIPYAAMEAIARVREHGNMKYKDPAKWYQFDEAKDQFVEAAQRHIAKYQDAILYHNRSEIDEESGLHHLDHAICTLALAIALRDKPKKER